jgi:hypothetical protein
LSEVPEILDPPVLETGPSDFAELVSAEQIVALHIDRKSEHPVFLESRIFLDSIKSLMLVAPNCSPPYFHPRNMLHSKIIEESNNFQAFVKISI